MTKQLGMPNIYLIDNIKAPRSSKVGVLLHKREASMKQNPIPSQTTSRLYQHPTVEEQRPSRFATIKANVIDFLIFIALLFVLWVIAVAAASWMMGG